MRISDWSSDVCSSDLLFHREGDDEVLLFRGQLGHHGDHAEVGIALVQVETAQQLAVEGEAVGIVGVGRGEEVPERRLDGRHLVAQGGIGVLAVADEVDRADRGDRPLVDLEGEVDAVLLELDDLRSEEHTSELQSLMRISYAAYCLQK